MMQRVKDTPLDSKNEESKEAVFPIVGIGASAGGLEAVTLLLKSLPVDLGMGFVVVQHLDPTHESVLSDLLSKATKMPVLLAKENLHINPNHIYVIPYNKDISILNGILKLSDRREDGKIHMPIDLFFTSLAQEQKENAIGVILSGTASDGTMGCKAIKENGGITFAQDDSAKYQDMPHAATAAGYVDFVLSPDAIAKELVRMSTHPYIHQLQAKEDRQELPEDETELAKIYFMLNKMFGIDFRHYKQTTMKRRIRRRMFVNKCSALSDYVHFLKDHKDEMDALHNDLLINVTSFFRDQQAFHFLHTTIIPRIIKDSSPENPIRVWVPACATGEEVYTIAMLIMEVLSDNSLTIPVQIFGTDVSSSAIEKARAGFYLQNEVASLSSSYLDRFFTKTDKGYQIHKSIRELCIFAQHNVIADPPFSRLDLISCCNLLIYLDPVLQDRLLHTFNYALKQDGFLMLGKSEAAGASPQLFSQIDKKYKVYTRKSAVMKGIITTGKSASRLDIETKHNTAEENEISLKSLDLQKEVDSILLNHYVPASVVVNNDLEIIQFRGSTGAYLEPSAGKASFNIIKMAREGLGFEIRSAISKVRKSNRSFKKQHIRLNQNGSSTYVSIEVIPLLDYQQAPCFLVLFEKTKEVLPESLPDMQQTSDLSAKDRRILELEQELAQIREDMRSITEEQEATNEELQAANEEILSSNEELQSINEELETSKEELESTNEELRTVNEELQSGNEQLAQARNYAEAIIRTVQVPLLILDHDLRIKTANRSFHQTFQVTEEETIGKYIYDLGNGQWDIPALRTLLTDIVPKSSFFDNYEIEHVFPSIGYKVVLLNARKFFRDGNNILLAIEDITKRKELERQKDVFIGIASHELKTPLTALKAYGQILEKRLMQTEQNSQIGHMVQKINEQVDRMTGLIADLLNTDKIQAGKLVLDKKKFDLNALVKKTIVDIGYAKDSHKIIMEGKIKTEVFGDENRIEQVITNLITNAIKYSPNADKVIIKLETNKNNAIVSVEDFGFGIEKEDQLKIFDRFYRTGTDKELNVEGFGLGLYISSEIIKAHAGKMWVESEKNKGSTFYFTLPF